MTYRTRTYIAAEWDGDSDAVQQLHKWNDSNHFSLSFTDAHDLQQSRDGSLNCSIKRSLAERLMHLKHLYLLLVAIQKVYEVVVVNTAVVKIVGQEFAHEEILWIIRSYIEYECEKAVRDGLKIVVLYNAATVDKSKCPDAVKYVGTHKAMCYYQNGQYYWDYQTVKSALG